MKTPDEVSLVSCSGTDSVATLETLLPMMKDVLDLGNTRLATSQREVLCGVAGFEIATVSPKCHTVVLYGSTSTCSLCIRSNCTLCGVRSN
jgi:hypothetical protein